MSCKYQEAARHECLTAKRIAGHDPYAIEQDNGAIITLWPTLEEAEAFGDAMDGLGIKGTVWMLFPWRAGGEFELEVAR